MISYFPVVTGSLSVSGSVNISGGITASGGITISGSIDSASYAATASFVALAQSASNAVSAATASYADALTVAGTLTAQTLVVQTITSSVDFVTGSTRFGSISANTHQFTGSMSVSGSVGVTGALTLNSAGNSIRSGNELRFYRADNGIYTRMYDAGALAANGFILDNTNAEGFHFQNNGTTVMRMNSSGNVGIGTISPVFNVDVVSASADSVKLRVRNTNATGSAGIILNPEGAGAGSLGDATIFHDVNSTAWVSGVDKSDSSKYKISNDVYGDFRANNYFTITTGGNVGINMTVPSQKLHLIGGFLQTADNSSWYRNVFERNLSTWDNIVGFTPGSSPQYTYGYINITASGYVNGTSAGGVTTSRWYYSITNNSISVSVVGSDISTGPQAPSIRLIVSNGTIYIQVQSATPAATSYTTVFVDAMLASGYVNGTYWSIA
jgi:hypothetical protein